MLCYVFLYCTLRKPLDACRVHSSVKRTVHDDTYGQGKKFLRVDKYNNIILYVMCACTRVRCSYKSLSSIRVVMNQSDGDKNFNESLRLTGIPNVFRENENEKHRYYNAYDGINAYWGWPAKIYTLRFHHV